MFINLNGEQGTFQLQNFLHGAVRRRTGWAKRGAQKRSEMTQFQWTEPGEHFATECDVFHLLSPTLHYQAGDKSSLKADSVQKSTVHTWHVFLNLIAFANEKSGERCSDDVRQSRARRKHKKAFQVSFRSSIALPATWIFILQTSSQLWVIGWREFESNSK